MGDIMGDQMVDAYSRMGRVMVVYVFVRTSLCLPQDEAVSALMMLRVLRALSDMALMCCVNVSLGSSVRPSIFGYFVVGRVMLLMWSERVVSYSAVSGVKSVVVVLLALSVSWLRCVHASIWCKYGWMRACATL